MILGFTKDWMLWHLKVDFKWNMKETLRIRYFFKWVAQADDYNLGVLLRCIWA